jgi:hypothetical protein
MTNGKDCHAAQGTARNDISNLRLRKKRQMQGARVLRNETYLFIRCNDEGRSVTQQTMVPFRVWTFYGVVPSGRNATPHVPGPICAPDVSDRG